MRQPDELRQALESKLRESDDPRLSETARVQRIILLTAAVCAGLAIQPLPFADILVLTPLQVYMAMKIGDIKGFPVSKKQAEDILKELGGMVGLGLLAQQGIAGLYKLGLPTVGGLMAAPLMFASTYAVGRIAEHYFDQKRAGKPILVDEVKRIWSVALTEGRRRAELFLGKESDTLGGAERGLSPRATPYSGSVRASFVAPRSTVVLYPGRQFSPGLSPTLSRCPNCGQEYDVPGNLLGHEVRCSRCRKTFCATRVE
jgi:uncharacterized protein (DUF697 family)